MLLSSTKAFFSHIPKCGGTWVSRVFDENSGVVHNDTTLSHDEIADLKHFGFIRNPWSWYVSWYNFNRYGSSQFAYDSPMHSVASGGDDSFEAMLKGYCSPTRTFKKKCWTATHHLSHMGQQVSHFRINGRWMTSSESYLEHLYSLYLTDAVRIGKFENLKEDLLSIVRELEITSPEIESRILTNPPVQVGKKVDYRTYYTDETAQMVQDTHSRIINLHGYTFDK